MICYRFAAYATPLRTVPAWQPARFSWGDENEPTQYLSLHPLGPLAELMRGADLRSPAQVRAIRTRTWALRVSLDVFDGPLDLPAKVPAASVVTIGRSCARIPASSPVACAA